MRLNETLYVGCQSEEIAEPGNSEVLVLSTNTMCAHATVASKLNDIFFRAIAQSRHFLDVPYKVSIIFPDNNTHAKRKDSDSESVYDRFKWYINHMLPPKNGIIFSIYLTEESVWKETEKVSWAINSVWPFRRQWKPLNKYVTIQIVEPETYRERGMHIPERVVHVNAAKLALKANQECYKIIESFCNVHDLEIKYIDYTMPYDEIYDLILGSNCHFSYPGATMYFAMACGTLTFCIHKFVEKDSDHDVYFSYQDPGSGKEKFEGKIKLYTKYGKVTNGPTRIQQYSPALDKIYQKHLDQLVDIASTKSFLQELEEREII